MRWHVILPSLMPSSSPSSTGTSYSSISHLDTMVVESNRFGDMGEQVIFFQERRRIKER